MAAVRPRRALLTFVFSGCPENPVCRGFRMKKSFTTILGLGLIVLSGCLYRDVRVPGPLDQVTNFQLTTDDFQIPGNVEGEGTIHHARATR